jgi:Domain of unknown function (DUF5666)
MMGEQPQVEQPQVQGPAAEAPATPTDGASTPPRSGLPTSTIVVSAILIAVLGFGVGFLVGHRTARPAFPFSRYAHMGAMPWMRTGEMPGTGMPGYGGMPGNGGSAGFGGMFGSNTTVPSGDVIVAGTVADVQGTTFTVRTLRGDTVTVVMDGSTIVGGVDGGTLAALRPGSRVLVAGVPQSDGSIAATHVFEGMFGSTASSSGHGASTSNANG